MNWKEIKNSGENGIYCWYLDEKVPTQFPYEDIDVDLISEDEAKKNDINQFDLSSVGRILDTIDLYFSQAIEYIRDCIKKSP